MTADKMFCVLQSLRKADNEAENRRKLEVMLRDKDQLLADEINLRKREQSSKNTTSDRLSQLEKTVCSSFQDFLIGENFLGEIFQNNIKSTSESSHGYLKKIES